MTYKRRSVPQYKRQTVIPLTRFTLPQKALRKLKDAEYVATTKCDICGSNTLKLYKRYIRGLPPQGYIVCTNPDCEAYGVVMPV